MLLRSKIAITLVVVFVFSTSLFAAPATQPTGRDVYLLPFTALGNDNSLDWAGKAVQENLLTDLARARFHPVAGAKAITDISDAQTAAKAAGARYLITGTYQLAEQLIRFNGQVIDVGTGRVIGGISATGAPRDLFGLEDSLSTQAIEQLGRANVEISSKPAKPIPDTLQAPSVLDTIQPPTVAAPGVASHYDGSALQAYVNANRTPSTDYAQQLQDANYRNTYGSFNDYGFGYGYGGLYSPYYFGGGYGLGLTYSIHYGGYTGGFYGGHRQHIVNADR